MDDSLTIMNPDSWPQPLLPMVRRQKIGMPLAGYLQPDAVSLDGRVKLMRGNVWDDKPATKFEIFRSVDALVAAGWKVD